MKHVGPISGVACALGKYVATAGYDNQVILWDAHSHQALGRVSHDHLANQCVFNAGGDLLATASSDYTARLWSVPSMRLRAVLDGHSDDVEMVAFSPEGERIATCSRDHDLCIWNLQGRLLARCTGHTADVISVAWMPSGETIVSSSDDGTVRRWRTSDGQQLGCSSFDGVETDTIAIGPDGLVLAGDDEGRISLIRDEAILASVDAHAAGIKRLVYSAATRKLVSLSYDRRMKLWDLEGDSLSQSAEADLPTMVWPRSCAFMDAHRIAFATFGSTYATFDISTGRWDEIDYQPSKSINAVLPSSGALLTVGDAGVVMRDGRPIADMGGLCNFLAQLGDRVITGGQMGSIHDALTGELIYQHHSPLNCACSFERNGQPHAAVGTYTGEAVVLRLADGRIENVGGIVMHDNAIKGLASDGMTIFSVSANRETAVAAVSTLKPVQTWPGAHDQIANGCAVVDRSVYCSVSRDRKLRIWRRKGIEVIETPHINSIKCVSAGGGRIATGDYGGRIAVYDLATKSWLGVVRPSTSGISSLAFDPSSGGFVASCYDGCVYEVGLNDAKSVFLRTRLDVFH